MSDVIKELRLKNFAGYRDETVSFTTGFNLLTGRNGAGKSKILDAIAYSLFGEVPGAKASALVSKYPGVSEMKTLVKFNGIPGGTDVQVFRVGELGQKGEFKTSDKRLLVGGVAQQLEGEDELKSKVAQLLGVTFRKFQDLIYVRQGEMSWILSPNRDQMDSLLQITLLRELRDQFDEVRRQYEKYNGGDVTTSLNALEPMLEEKRNELKTIDDDTALLRKETDEIADVVKKGESRELLDLIRLIGLQEAAANGIRDVSTKISDVLGTHGASSQDDLQKQTDEIAEKIKGIESEREILAKRVGDEMSAWAKLQGGTSVTRTELENHTAMLAGGAGVCPACGQDVSAEKLEKLIEDGKKDLADLVEKESKALAAYAGDRKKLDDLSDVSKYTYMMQENARAKQALDGYAQKRDELLKASGDLRTSISATLKALGLPFSAEDDGLKVKVAQRLPIGAGELDGKKTLLSFKRSQLDGKLAYHRSVVDWITKSETLWALLKTRLDKAALAKSFSDQFGSAIESRRGDILSNIEFRALEYYKQMTDQQVYSSFTINPDDYTVHVNHKDLTQPIPATRVGGGHQTVISLAVRLALMDVTGCKRLLLLDEPTDGVDDQNMPQLARYFGDLSNYVEQVIMVTHFDICEEVASSILEITADQNGSHCRLHD